MGARSDGKWIIPRFLRGRALWRTQTLKLTSRAGNEPSRAELGSARFGSASERAELGSARYFCEPENQARLGSVEAREPAREPH